MGVRHKLTCVLLSFLTTHFPYTLRPSPSPPFSTHPPFPSLGIQPSRVMMEELLSSRPGSQGHSPNPSEDKPGINFTMFLTMMSERLVEFDTEPELIEAFESFDENGLTRTATCRTVLAMGVNGDSEGESGVPDAYAKTGG